MPSTIDRHLKDTIGLVYKKSDLDQLLFDLQIFTDKISYKSVIHNTDNDNVDRKQFVKTEISKITSDILRWYFEYLISKEDLFLFDPGQIKIFREELAEQSKKFVIFKIITAIELKNSDVEDISYRLTKKLGRKVLVDTQVDKTILAGSIIKKDNYIMDFSLKTRLYLFGEEWKKAIRSTE